MNARLLQLAKYDRVTRKLGFLGWMVWVVLLIFIVTALLGPGGAIKGDLFGLFFIFLPLGVVVDLFRLFLRSEVGITVKKQAKTPGGLTYESALIIVRSHGDAHRLWYELLQDASVQFVLLRFGLEPKTFYSLLTQFPTYNAWLESATQAAKNQNQLLRPEHLFEIVQVAPALTAKWQELAITPTERQDVWLWWNRLFSEKQRQSRGFADSLRYSGGIGRDWTSGYTQYLEIYASDITRDLLRYHQTVSLVGHKEEREKVLEYLSRDQRHNVMLIGDEGIGKQRMLFTLASDFNAGTVPPNLKYKHVYLLDVGRVLSGANQNEVEMRLHNILEEASTVGNAIVVIPDFHLLVGAQGNQALGVVNASAVLSPYLQSSAIQIIGTITPQAYYTFIKANAELDSALMPVEIHEIQATDALHVLEDEIWRYEGKSGRLFTYQALLKLVEIADLHIHDKPYPEKVLALADDVGGAMASSLQRFITSHDVEQVVSETLKIPVGAASTSEREVLNNLENLIQAKIVGQKEAVGVVANALRRARAGLNSGRRPIGSFLFLGPTGVGKTEMARTIAAIYYKNPKAFIRVDMSEYQTPDAVDKLLGTRETTGVLSTAVTDQPFSVVLLDEIEKAAVPVRNLFLQILDNGYVTDGFGGKVDFTNSMVIATSNAGAQLIRDAVNQGTVDADFKAKLLDWLQTQGIFSPEWLNRFDAVVTFLPLSRDEIRQVATLQVQELVDQLKSHNINLTLSDDVYDVLVEKGYDPQFGARPMRRAVQDIIENALAKQLLNDSTEGMKSITLTKAMLPV